MSPPVPADLNDILSFLRDVGYGDFYLPKAEVGEQQRARGAARPPTASAARPSTPQPSTARDSTPPATAAAVATPDVPDSPQLRAERLDEWRHRASSCRDCRLSEKRHSVVFGSGDPNADLMFIGEGPGAEEDRQGLPFVGEAGQLLTRIVEAIDLRREEVYIANVVKCRPPGNRDPQPDEISACRGYLERQVDLVQPKLIVALGKVATHALLGTDGTLKSMRGRWYSFRGVPVRVTYHPAALLRNRGFKRPTWEDMQVVRDELRRLA